MEDKEEKGIPTPYLSETSARPDAPKPVVTDIKEMFDQISEENLDKIQQLLGADGVFVISFKKIKQGMLAFDNLNVASKGIVVESIIQTLENIIKTLKK